MLVLCHLGWKHQQLMGSFLIGGRSRCFYGQVYSSCRTWTRKDKFTCIELVCFVQPVTAQSQLTAGVNSCELWLALNTGVKTRWPLEVVSTILKQCERNCVQTTLKETEKNWSTERPPALPMSSWVLLISLWKICYYFTYIKHHHVVLYVTLYWDEWLKSSH